MLSETPGRCVPYAVIEGEGDVWGRLWLARARSDACPVAAGVVRSVKETLNSQFVENCKGVIERLTLKEEKMVWNRTTHIW